MFDFFRSREKSARYLLTGLLILVAISMLLYLAQGPGIQGATTSVVLADVGGDKVTMRDVQQGLSNYLKGRNLPPEMVDYLVPQFIDKMISDRAKAYEAERMGFKVNDAALATTIASIVPDLFIDGKYVGDEALRQRLATQGLTVQQFQDLVRKQMLVVTLENIVAEGIVVSPQEIENEYHRRNDKAAVEYVGFDAAKLRPQATATPEELQAYFKANRTAFTIPEKRSFDLVVVDDAHLAQNLQIPEQDLQAAYNAQLERYKTKEQVHARHILVKVDDKAKDADARKKAEDLLKQVRGGADFAEVAKKSSDDTGSGAQGGDLGFFSRGQMVPEFEQSAFSLKANQISDLIKTQFGYHIIQVLERKDATVRSFDQARAELETELKRQRVQDKLQSTAEQVRAALVKTPSQAEQIAKQFGVGFARVNNAAGEDPVPEVGINPELRGALAATKPGTVTSVVPVAPSKLVVASVTGSQPSRPAELAEVEPQVKEAVLGQKTQQLVKDRAQQAAQQIKAGTPIEQVAKNLNGDYKKTPLFSQSGAVEGMGPAGFVMDAFVKPVGTVMGPFPIESKQYVAKSTEQQKADSGKITLEDRTSMIDELKNKKRGERAQLFQEGLVRQLEANGSIKIYKDRIDQFIKALKANS